MDKNIFNGENSGTATAMQTCSITGKPYEGYGNNAYPFEGRCSDEANSRYVIPARLMSVTPEMITKWGKETVMRAVETKAKEIGLYK